MSEAGTIGAIEAAIGKALSGPAGLCAQLEVEGDPASWVQFVDDQVNAACRDDTQPDALLAELGLGAATAFGPGQYVTLSTTETDPAVIACWIDGWFRGALGVREGYRVVATFEQL